MSNNQYWKLLLSITVIVFGITFGILFLKTKTEQNTFNRCTNSNVGYWEAAFTELRVENCNPKDTKQ